MIARNVQAFQSFRFSAAGFLAALAVSFAAFCLAAAADAQTGEVSGQTTWRAAGGFEVTGRVLGHDGTYLRLQTEAGPITIDPAGLTCEGAACPDPDLSAPSWHIVGAPRIGETLLPSLIEGFAFASGYEAVRTETGTATFDYALSDRETGKVLARFALQLTSGAKALAALQSQEADAGLHVGALPEPFVVGARRAGLGDLAGPRQVRVLAFDGLVPVVAPRLAVPQISLDDLVAAFRDEVRGWSEIGGPDLPLRLHLAPFDHAAWFGQTQLAGGALSDAVTLHEDAAGLTAAVEAIDGGLGLVSFRDEGDAQPVPVAGHCGPRIAADAVSLRTRDYPLTMPLILVVPDRRRPPLAEEFLAWLDTDRAEAVVRRVGFVDLGIVPIPIESQGGRLAEAIARAGQDVSLAELQAMVAAMDGRVRLSPTFRFEADTLDLDLASRAALDELALQIAAGRFDGRSLLLAGFSDGQGPAQASRAMSGARAEAVLDALARALGGALPEGVRVRTRAFGEALPMGCDDTDWGRRINRRVELWVEE